MADIAPAEVLKQTLEAAERAMALEGVPADIRRRVINRVIYGHPDGAQARVFLNADQQLTRKDEATSRLVQAQLRHRPQQT